MVILENNVAIISFCGRGKKKSSLKLNLKDCYILNDEFLVCIAIVIFEIDES